MSGMGCRLCHGSGWIKQGKKKVRCPGDNRDPLSGPLLGKGQQSQGALGGQVQTTLDLDDMFSRFKVTQLPDNVVHEEEHVGIEFRVAGPIPGATGGFLAGIPERLEINGRFVSPADSMWHHLVYDDEGGITLSPERLALYQDIVHRHLANVPRSDNPVFVFMGGGPAAGKTSMRDAFGLGDGKVAIAADEIKEMLPEYADMQNSGHPAIADGAALFTHDESSFITYEIQRQALANRQSVLLDGCGGGPPEKLLAKANEARQYGFRIEGRYITCPTNEAVDGCISRAEKEKRHVHFDSLLNGHRSVSKVIPVAMQNGTFDDLEIYDRTGVPRGEPPILIMKSNSSGSRVFSVKRWKAFVGKARGDRKAVEKIERYEERMRETRGDYRGVVLSWAAAR